MKLAYFATPRAGFNKKPGISKSDPPESPELSGGLINTAFYILFSSPYRSAGANIFVYAPKGRLTARLVRLGARSCNAYDMPYVSAELVPAGEVTLLDRDLSNLISYCRITRLLFSPSSYLSYVLL